MKEAKTNNNNSQIMKWLNRFGVFCICINSFVVTICIFLSCFLCIYCGSIEFSSIYLLSCSCRCHHFCLLSHNICIQALLLYLVHFHLSEREFLMFCMFIFGDFHAHRFVLINKFNKFNIWPCYITYCLNIK